MKAGPITYADIIAVIVGIVFILIGGYKFANGGGVSTSAMMGLICIVPTILKVIGAVNMPNPIILLIAASVGLHTYGLISGAYITVEQFDTVTHTLSSMTIGILLFYVMMVVQYYGGNKVNFTGTGLSIITALLAMSFSVYWEVIEYAIDVLTTAVTQYSPYDTMTDLVCDSVGTILASVWVGIYMKKRTADDIVRSFNLGAGLNKGSKQE